MRNLSKSIKNFFSPNTENNEDEMRMVSSGGNHQSEESFPEDQQLGTFLKGLSGTEKEPLLNFDKINSVLNKEAKILVTNLKGEIIYVNDKCSDSLGYHPEELMGKHSRILQTLKHSAAFYRDLEKTFLSGEVWKGEITAKSKDGLIKWYFMSIYPLFNNQGKLNQLLTIRREITDVKKLEEKALLKEKQLQSILESLTYFDSLTGLPNQRYFEERLNKEMEFAKENHMNFAVVKVGLDDFKYVNSTFGHSTGDQLLRVFTGRMKSAFNENVFIHKTIGDNFILLIKNIEDYDEIHKKLDSLIERINQESFHIEGNDIHVTVSIGVSVFPYSGENADDLVKNAEIAMFHAKNNGKNQYQIFSSTMSLVSYKQFILRNDSKKALLRNELDVYFQPRMNPMTNEMLSAEGLIRWIHPEWGLVLPDEFISMAEDSGLIIPIGEWMIREICQKLKQWEMENLPIKKISINLSPIQLLQANFVDMVSSILQEFKVNPKWIEFEITENVFIEKEEQVLITLTALKEMGITIALDDFGTGYSSLNYLRKFPCDIIKIDRSLIREIHKDPDNFEIISSIISLCHKLKKSVVAEGVETEEQLSLLQQLHCNEIQGYLYSKPVDEKEYKRFLIEGISNRDKQVSVLPDVNKREFFRVPLIVPLLADMTIGEIEHKKINIGSTEIVINDIGPGGLRFSSSLKLPVGKNMILLFTTEILSSEWHLKGEIIWQKELDDNQYQYGLKFIINDQEQEKLIKVLNKLQLKLKQKSVLPDCRFMK